MNVILVTACPSGMATTFLAARRLEQAAKRRDWKVTVEMHGELEPLTPASQDAIEAAELIVVAADHVPEPQRFEGKRLFQAAIDQALPDPAGFLERASRDAAIYRAPLSKRPRPRLNMRQALYRRPDMRQALYRRPNMRPDMRQALYRRPKPRRGQRPRISLR